MDEASPRRWLLISREVGVPSEEDGADRWSLDHLFLDQDAIPTLIEVKRSSDTRIRREVVGQLLDYGANAVVYWPAESIRARFEETCRQRGVEPDKEVASLVGVESAAEEFWHRFKTNIQAGRIRMVFVADVIPPELRRIVEFLNGQMDPAEVLAVEIRQYVGQGLKTLVPRVIGQTAEAEQRKGSARTSENQWDETSFFTALAKRRGQSAVEGARRILNWAKTRNLRIWWGKGSKDASFVPVFGPEGKGHFIVSVWTYGSLEVNFQYMAKRKPFSDEAKRIELLNRLNQVPEIEIPADGITRRPSISLAILANENVSAPFLAVLDWFFAEVKGASVERP
jgi:hypothetical protein